MIVQSCHVHVDPPKRWVHREMPMKMKARCACVYRQFWFVLLFSGTPYGPQKVAIVPTSYNVQKCSLWWDLLSCTIESFSRSRSLSQATYESCGMILAMASDSWGCRGLPVLVIRDGTELSSLVCPASWVFWWSFCPVVVLAMTGCCGHLAQS